MTRELAPVLAPALLALIIGLVRAYGPAAAKRVPSAALPWVAVALSGVIVAALRALGIELPALEGEFRNVLVGIIGGTSAAGMWSLTAVVRKPRNGP